MMKLPALLFLAALTASLGWLSASPVRAQEGPAVNFASLGTGFNYSQGSFSIGWKFATNQDVTVTALGTYDDNMDGLSAPSVAGIYDAATCTLLVSATVAPDAPLTGFFRFTEITPTVLPGGKEYYVVSLNGADDYAIFVSDVVVDPSIAFEGFAAFGGDGGEETTTLQCPTGYSQNNSQGDFGGNFKLQTGPVAPTPAPTATPIPTATPTPSPSPTPPPVPTPGPFPTPPPTTSDLSCLIISPPVDAPVAAGDPLSIAVAVSDRPDLLVTAVYYYIDGTLVGMTDAEPFFVTLTAPAAGKHLLQAVAQDSGGRTTTGTEPLTTYVPGNPPPDVADVDGLDGDDVVGGETVTTTAEAIAKGASNSITALQFYADGTPMNGGTASPIGYQRRGPNPVRLEATMVAPLTGGGSLYRLALAVDGALVGHDLHLFAVATDANGEKQISAVSTLHVKDAAAGTPPVVTLGLAEGTRMRVGEATAVPVTVTGANGATLIQYLVNGQVATDSNASPDGFSFTPPAAGQYLLNATATDSSGLSGFGAPTLVTAADVPVVSLKIKGDGTATAGGAPGKVLVSRTGDTSVALSVSYKATSTEAVSGVDYRALTGRLVIPAGASSAKIKLSALTDRTLDGAAKVKIKLKPSADGSYTLDATSKVQLKLLDND